MSNKIFSTLEPCTLNPFMIQYKSSGGRVDPPDVLQLPLLKKLFHAGVSFAYDTGLGFTGRPVEPEDKIKVVIQQHLNIVPKAVLSLTPAELAQLADEIKCLSNILTFFNHCVVNHEATQESGEIK